MRRAATALALVAAACAPGGQVVVTPARPTTTAAPTTTEGTWTTTTAGAAETDPSETPPGASDAEPTSSLPPAGPESAPTSPGSGDPAPSSSEPIPPNSVANGALPVDMGEVGYASWYGAELAGNPTASGEPFDPDDLTAAHRSLPFGTLLRVCADGCVVVRVNDRGPFVAGRVLDLSRAAFATIAPLGAGVARVTWAVA